MATPLNILVVEDHDLLRQTIVAMLVEHGYRAEGVYSAEEVDVHASNCVPDVYIIDLNLPGEDGISLAGRLRKSSPNSGIIIVSARGDLVDRLMGYKTGAEVYLTKPFDSDELLAIIESIEIRIRLFRSEKSQHSFHLDRKKLVFKGPIGEVILTQAEVGLLSAMYLASDKMLSHRQIADHLNLDRDPAFRSTLNVRLSQLRKKLSVCGAEEPMIRAVRGVGYKLCLAFEFF